VAGGHELPLLWHRHVAVLPLFVQVVYRLRLVQLHHQLPELLLMAATSPKRLLWPVVGCLTLGLAPFSPMPHFFEKISWLATGRPFAPIDIFDLFLHGAPWIWLVVELVRLGLSRWRPATEGGGSGGE
jgi:hypothetical protein